MYLLAIGLFDKKTLCLWGMKYHKVSVVNTKTLSTDYPKTTRIPARVRSKQTNRPSDYRKNKTPSKKLSILDTRQKHLHKGRAQARCREVNSFLRLDEIWGAGHWGQLPTGHPGIGSPTAAPKWTQKRNLGGSASPNPSHSVTHSKNK